MAEGLFRNMVRGRDDIRVASAGVHAPSGQPPSPYAVDALAEWGIDISRQRSQPISERLVEEADLIFGMTRGHLETLQMLFPEAADKAFLVREFDETADPDFLDVPDPIGQSRAVYLRCRDVLRRALPSLVALLDGAPSNFTPKPNPPGGRSGYADSHPMQTTSNFKISALSETDPEIVDAIAAEEVRQSENIELIASENFTSRAVREAQGSVLTNKYAEGYPGQTLVRRLRKHGRDRTSGD